MDLIDEIIQNPPTSQIESEEEREQIRHLEELLKKDEGTNVMTGQQSFTEVLDHSNELVHNQPGELIF